MEVRPISVEITYGLERITAYIQGLDSAWDVKVAPGLTYRDLFLEQEKQNSKYGFEIADVPMLRQSFDGHERDTEAVGDRVVLPGVRSALKCSHAFNM